MMEYTIEKRTDNVTWYRLKDKNAKKESLLIEISECENQGGKNALPVLWYKNGYVDRVLGTYLCIDTYCTDSEGNCWGMYNPQVKLSDDCKRQVINFDWMFENTEENKMKLVNEAIRLFETAQGKSSTEIKLEKIYQFANDHNLTVYKEVPKDWTIENAVTYPKGSTRVTKGKFFIRDVNGKLVKNPEYKEGLLIL